MSVGASVRWLGLTLALAMAVPAHAQQSQFSEDLRREGERIKSSCDSFSPGSLASCVYTLVTDNPFKLGLGSLAPGNGFAFGVAFSERFTPNEAWRLTWNGDVVTSPSGSWRGAGSMKIVHSPATSGVVVAPAGSATRPPTIRPREYTVIDLFAQTTTLDSIGFYGIGPTTTAVSRTLFGERQTAVGGAITVPLGSLRGLGALQPALVGGVTGRFIDVRSSTSDRAPSVETRFSEGEAPGLAQRTSFAQFTEGLRIAPSLAGGRLLLRYAVTAQQFRSSRASLASFDRWTIDLQHEIPLWGTANSSTSREFNGPNDCSQAMGSSACPPVSRSRNRRGSIGLRLRASSSVARTGHRVPFFLQPTLGGSDLNGERGLAGFDDYRFRAPHTLLLQETFDHSIWGPIGVYVQAEQGMVRLRQRDLGLHGLETSTTIGLSIRAGGFPMVNLSLAFSREGRHLIGAVNSALLGGSARPSLF